MADMLENVPWAVEGGKISGAVMRMLADDIAPGKTGVRQSSDFKVRALEAATDAVRIAPGGYTAYNEYSGGSGQAYKGRAAEESTISVPNTGSQSGATHYVIIRISDPQFPNEPVPADVLNGPYNWFEVVPSITNLNFPHVPLAKITQPINNTVVTQAMIEDIRELANPRTWSVLRPLPQHAGDPGQALNNDTDGEWFPNVGPQDIFIPKWAVRMQIVADWTQINYADVNSVGRCWIEWGPYLAPSERKYKTEKFGFNGGGGGGGVARGNWRVGDDVYIPAEERGQIHKFVYKANYNTGSAKGVSMDGLSGTIMQVRFVEDPD